MSSPTRRQYLAQTAAFGATVLGVPALLRSQGQRSATGAEAGAEEGGDEATIKHHKKKHSLFGDHRQPFDSRPRRSLAEEQPEYLFFGDSMARAHIDPEAVTRLTGRKGGVFYLPHSTSARWYLMLKNYIIPSGVRPRKMFVLFRNCLWHMPSFRIDGTCWDDLERAMEDPADPIIAQVIGLEPRRGASPAAQFLRDQMYPVQTHAEQMRQQLQKLAANLCGLDFEQAKALSNQRTSWENFRKGITAETNYDGLTDGAQFTMDPHLSFFPHFLDLAQRASIPLHFVRVRRRPVPSGRVPNPENIEIYMQAMQAELKSRGLGFYDGDTDTELKADMYAEGDHLDAKYRTWFTERLIQRMGKEVFT
jgi:hypothetical protein